MQSCQHRSEGGGIPRQQLHAQNAHLNAGRVKAAQTPRLEAWRDLAAVANNCMSASTCCDDEGVDRLQGTGHRVCKQRLAGWDAPFLGPKNGTWPATINSQWTAFNCCCLSTCLVKRTRIYGNGQKATSFPVSSRNHNNTVQRRLGIMAYTKPEDFSSQRQFQLICTWPRAWSMERKQSLVFSSSSTSRGIFHSSAEISLAYCCAYPCTKATI